MGAIRSWNWAVALLAAALGGCARVTVYENQPLVRPAQVVSVERPGVLVLAGGDRVRVAGVWLFGPVDDALTAIGAGAAAKDGRAAASPEVEVASAGESESRADFKRRLSYFCGNTVGRIPEYGRGDVGAHWVSCGLAVPTVEAVSKGDAYARELVRGLEGWATPPSMVARRLGDDSSGRDVAVRVGRYLMSGSFEAAVLKVTPNLDGHEAAELSCAGWGRVSGAALLVVAREPDAAELIGERLGQIPPRAGKWEAEKLLDLLAIADPAAARRQVTRIVMAGGDEQAHLRASAAGRAVRLGDTGPMDEVMRQLQDAGRDAVYRAGLDGALRTLFGLNADGTMADEEFRRRMGRWYGDVKGRLRWNPRGAAFWFGDEATRKDYYASVAEYFGAPASVGR